MLRRISLVAALWILAAAATAVAQPAWPDRPVRVVAPYPAGGSYEIVLRLMSPKLEASWGKPVVIESQPGAGGSVGTARVAKSAPDGYTLGLPGDAPLVVNPTLHGSSAYDPLRDLVPITRIGLTPNILVVNNDLPVRNVQELVALARAKPGDLTFASQGIGTSQHLCGEMLKLMAKIDMLHVPYKEHVLPDLLAGRVNMQFGNVVLTLPQVRAGTLRAIAVTTPQRLPALPEVPTMAEAGYPDFYAGSWFGLVAPAGTSQAIVRRVHEDVARALSDPELRAKIEERGVQLIVSTPEEFGALIRTETQRMADLIRAAGIKAE
ncbi:MAG: tripartite tricarboxylate transporter substrate binding protein [Proteobacteria bacterium]|nr:tripartite tricarboxylate transporter substrate binding protein [Pseudomonadota bacterium]